MVTGLEENTMMLTRRNFMLGTALASGAALLGMRPAYAQQADLRLAFWGSQARADRTYAVVDQYTAANPNVAIEGDFAAWADYWPKLATQTAGGNAPDLVQMDIRYLVEYARRGVLAPLDPFLGSALNLDEFDPDQAVIGRVDDTLYAVPIGASSAAQFVNTSAFERVGGKLPDRDTTFDDLMEMAEPFKSDGSMSLTADESGSELVLENWLRQRGKPLYTAEGKLGFDVDDMTEWYLLWNKFRNNGVCLSAEQQADTTVDPLTSGKCALWVQSANQLIGFQALTPDALSLNNIQRIAPGSGGGHYLKPSSLWTISETSSNKEAAAAFIDYFVNNPEAGRVLGVDRGVPSALPIRDVVRPTLDELSLLTMEYVEQLGDLMGPVPPAPPLAAGEIQLSLLITTAQEVSFGQRSAEDGAAAVIAGANDILSRA
ncbi:MAG TPA: ABC transporter substrate-binding protein [Ramlibacter sp.]|jgi:multiple sugar transport system substrate-binding protein